MKKLIKISTLMLLLTFFIFQLTASADTTPEAASKTLNISLTIGKTDIIVNGTKLSGEPPYITKDGSTLVPLRVITTAFGTVPSYDATTKTIGLKYNDHDLSLTIDNKVALVDGKSVKMLTAPQLRNNTTMVPVRFITENFGAVITFDKITKEITIKGDAPALDTSLGLNNDAGKTKIGDSYNNWTLKYPTGLVKSYQSYKGDYLNFDDANGEYALTISIDPTDVQNMTADGLLSELVDYVGGTILSKTTSTVNGVSFARIISKDDDIYTESRAYFANGNAYLLTMDILNEKNYKNPLKSAGYKEFLDSFTLSFDTKDSTVKDISTVKDGYRTYANEDYGFSLNIPADWNKGSEESSSFSFNGNEPKDTSLHISVNSLAVGETLDTWEAKTNQDLADMYVLEYRSAITTKSITIGGEPAKDMIADMNPDGTWITENEFLVIKGNLKYDIELIYPKDSSITQIQTIKENLINSFTFTDKINSEVGTIENTINKTNLSKIVSKNLGLSFEKPEYWKDSTPSDSKNTNLYYSFPNGFISIASAAKTKIDTFEYMEKTLKANDTITITANTTTTLAGQSAKKITYTNSDNGAPVYGEVYIYSSSTKDYVIIYQIGAAFNTEIAKKRIAALIASFQITTP